MLVLHVARLFPHKSASPLSLRSSCPLPSPSQPTLLYHPNPAKLSSGRFLLPPVHRQGRCSGGPRGSALLVAGDLREKGILRELRGLATTRTHTHTETVHTKETQGLTIISFTGFPR